MGKLNNYKKIKIKDICIWERAKKGKIYKKGSFCVQVSATRGQMQYINSDQEIEGKWCVFRVIDESYNPEYVYIIFKECIKEFLARVQTGLNIVPDVFYEYELELHQDRETQDEIVNIMKYLEERIQEEEKTVGIIKEFKKYHLGKMFY